MKVHIDWMFCHNRKCKRLDCLRHEKNMEYNVLSKVSSADKYLKKCNEETGYPEILLQEPAHPELSYEDFGYSSDFEYEEDIDDTSDSKKNDNTALVEDITESSQGYISFLNDIVKHSRVKFYIEPFVGNSRSILKIEGVPNKFGTDINKEKLERKMKECKGSSKEFQVKDYKVWDRVILSDTYKGKCIVFCEPPRHDSEHFNMEEFINKMKEWGAKNKVYVRCNKLKRRKPLFIIKEGEDYIYQLY